MTAPLCEDVNDYFQKVRIQSYITQICIGPPLCSVEHPPKGKVQKSYFVRCPQQQEHITKYFEGDWPFAPEGYNNILLVYDSGEMDLCFIS